MGPAVVGAALGDPGVADGPTVVGTPVLGAPEGLTVGPAVGPAVVGAALGDPG